jgi:hypothetical protein
MINETKASGSLLIFSESFTSFIVHLDRMEPLHNCALHLRLFKSAIAVRVAFLCFDLYLMFSVWIPE